MKFKFGMALAMAGIFSCALAAQNSTPADAQATGQAAASGKAATAKSKQAGNQDSPLGVGTAFNATLEQSLDSKKLKIGDTVNARTTEDVRLEGKTVIPKGAKLIGHVTQASAKSKGDTDSSLTVVFDKAELKGKQEMPIYATIQALAAPPPPPVPAGADGNFPTDNRTNPNGRQPMAGVAPNTGGAVGTQANSVPPPGTLGSPAQGTVDSAGRVVNGAADQTVGGTGGVNTAGQLMLNSRGVFGINGIALKSVDATRSNGPVIISENKSVHLEEGTRLLLLSRAQS
jgi:hypothetical protein